MIAATGNGQLWWYVARAGGLVAWALLSASVVVGLLAGSRWPRALARAAWTVDLHRFLGGLAVAFTAVHVGAILADSCVEIGWRQVVVPFTGTWHPVAVAWGAVAAQLLVAVEVTSLARRHLPRRWWRAVHLASFPLFALATVHLLSAGTDRSNAVLRLLAALAVTTVIVLTGVRVVEARSRRTARTPVPVARVTPAPPPYRGAVPVTPARQVRP